MSITQDLEGGVGIQMDEKLTAADEDDDTVSFAEYDDDDDGVAAAVA